jgi:hypothetical protein
MEVNRKAPVVALAEGLIRAPLYLVWSVHTNIAEWSRWNPEVQSVTLGGPVETGTRFRWKTGGTTIVSKIEEVEPHRRIVWTGRAFGILGLRAIHVFTFSEREEGVWVSSEESFEGLIAVLFGGAMRRRLGSDLQKSLVALKKECERRVQ